MNLYNARSKGIKKLKSSMLIMLSFAITLSFSLFSSPFSQPAAAAGNSDSKFPPVVLDMLKSKTGLDSEQWDNIMKLVNKPEQDNLNWTKYYGYCEDIGDDRGYTMTIYGATTGGPNDPGGDAPELFEQYDAEKGASNPSVTGAFKRLGIKGTYKNGVINITDGSFCKKINKLQNDEDWKVATWKTFYNIYIKYSVDQARKRGFNSALTIGSFVDAALNHGATGGSNTLQGLLSKSGSSSDEKTFMTKFYKERTKIVDTNDYNQPPNGKNRVKQYSNLMNMGETDLKNADSAIAQVTDWEMQ
ncbi:chitosanase [Paenibacillus tuaregi]|uniref:chitosanase n=1 Tax=Paenibacillus tuaregi TaxID=1816681 RepID=UPI00083808B4